MRVLPQTRLDKFKEMVDFSELLAAAVHWSKKQNADACYRNGRAKIWTYLLRL